MLSRPPVNIMSGKRHTGRPPRSGSRRWLAVILSVVGSAVAVAAVGSLCALGYPILKELRAERVKGENGIEERMLGFWSVLILSVLGGCISCISSWTLTYFDSYQPGMGFLASLTLLDLRDGSGHGIHLNCAIAALNGIMAMLTVVWSLS